MLFEHTSYTLSFLLRLGECILCCQEALDFIGLLFFFGRIFDSLMAVLLPIWMT
jgi:hypothetical protein